MKAKVSFAISMYNTAQYLERCMRTLFEQTMDDVEYVVVDDGSTDDSCQMLMDLVEQYPHRKQQLKIIHHECNKGSAEAKKNSYLAATGEYVIAIDSDDFVDRNMAKIMYSKAKEVDADLVVCGVYRETSKNMRLAWISNPEMPFDQEVSRRDMISRRVIPGLWCRLVRRSILDNPNFIWPTNNFAEDVVISIQMAIFAHRIARVDVPLYNYCYNQSSLCHKNDNDAILRRFHEDKANMELVIEILKKHGLYHDYKYDIIPTIKIPCRNTLLPLTKHYSYRKMWFKTFPEVNRHFLVGHQGLRPSYREWIWYISVITGNYQRFKKKLKSPALLMRQGWSFPEESSGRLFQKKNSIE